MDIRISDAYNQYDTDRVYDAMSLVEEYIAGLNPMDDDDWETIQYLRAAPLKESVRYVAEVWELGIEFLS